MNDVMLKQYNLLPEQFQKEVNNYIEYLFVKTKKLNNQKAKKTTEQEKNAAYKTLIQYAGCIPSHIDYKQDAAETAIIKYESLT